MNRLYEKALVCFSVASLLVFSQLPCSAKETVKLLTVGNSFAINATQYLPDLVKSFPDCELLLGAANIGGAPLDKHYKLAIESETDGNIKPYRYRKAGSKEKSRKVNLKEILAAEKWDVITIQQYSAYSFKREKFVPYFKNLHDYIKKQVPQARIMVHQTWAYRADDARFRKQEFKQADMYRLLTENYRFFAKKSQCAILPSGAAFDLCRKKQQPAFSFPDPDFDYADPVKGSLPKQEGSLNVGWRWSKGKFSLDAHHANERGCYLAACVWFEKLFGKDVRQTDFVPDVLQKADAKFLQQIAHETVASFE
ncbi:MAG: DUF4886 domain-containing protein [Verrucomicrobiota bacterium]